jgi:SurA N-terminal domain
MMTAMRQRVVVAVVAGVLLVAGCGGDGDDEAEVPPPAAAAKSGPKGLPSHVVARVGAEDITKAEVTHWTAAARKQGQCKTKTICREQAMQFLVSSEWVVQHAEQSRVKVSEKEVTRLFNKQKREAFPRERDYRAFLKSSGRTEADLRFQVRLSLLTDKMQKAIGGSSRGKTQQERLDVFVAQFRRTYKRQTICRRAYSPKKQCGKIVD